MEEDERQAMGCWPFWFPAQTGAAVEMLFSAVVGRLHSTCCCSSEFYDSVKMPLPASLCKALDGFI